MSTKKKDAGSTGEDAGQTQTPPKADRKPRTVKVKHAEGSSHYILNGLVERLTPTEATVLLRMVKKHYAGIDVANLDLESLDGEATDGIKSKLAKI